MESFICLNCKYRFKSDKKPRTCPYCDKPAVDREKSASEILSEIDTI